MKQLALPKLSKNVKVFLNMDEEDYIKDYLLLL